ncbi:hypothetical protein Rsub_05280 [Raphidocelis subcapitata]|uniref:Uncharacterized protein n=1 Tax=Raphidocelis subcapitata TaxID=307507 RepID=A0A2V0NX29_9CHLO|nr:hypothetical protein Rsub_05280 [Raphidocelis subcapitata]|eukprot:GBF92198.1 hypothetical protein Rsub_05280 [Raphidocelis subcapitata]
MAAAAVTLTCQAAPVRSYAAQSEGPAPPPPQPPQPQQPDAMARLERRVAALERHLAPAARAPAGAPGPEARRPQGGERRPPRGGGEGGAGGDEDSGGDGGGGKAGGDEGDSGGGGLGAAVADEAAEALRELHPRVAQVLSSGYLESQRELRERLMALEWDGAARAYARAKGVAEFERAAEERGLGVPFEADPDDLSALPDEHHRALARATIAAVEADRRMEVYKACSETAKTLANLQPQSTGLAAVGALLRRLLPIPGLR